MNNVRNKSISIGVASIFLIPIVVSDYGYAGVKQPFNPAQYDKVITAPNDKTEFISIGHDDSMGARELDSISAPALPPTPVDPGKVETPEIPDATTIAINCGSIPEMQLQKEYLGDSFNSTYGSGIASDESEYIVTYDITGDTSTIVGVTKVGEDGTRTLLDPVIDINSDHIRFAEPVLGIANPSCKVKVFNIARKVVANGYQQTGTCGNSGQFREMSMALIIKPGYPSVTVESLTKEYHSTNIYQVKQSLEQKAYTHKLETTYTGSDICANYYDKGTTFF
ncbi:hypothetical protein FG475_20445 [Vibrio navarrensis]|nr:hypothetical protein [Vibrio navarrensis]